MISPATTFVLAVLNEHAEAPSRGVEPVQVLQSAVPVGLTQYVPATHTEEIKNTTHNTNKETAYFIYHPYGVLM